MKKHITLLLIMFVIMACSSGDTNEDMIVCKDFIISASGNLQLQENGHGVELTLKANCRWTISSSVDWLTVTPIQGMGNGIITVTAEKNLNTADRQAELVIHAGAAPIQRVVVTQLKASVIEDTHKEPGANDNVSPSY